MSEKTPIEEIQPPKDSRDPEQEGVDKPISSADGDAALGIFDLDVSEGEVALVDRKKLLRKIDIHLIPIV